MVAITGGPEGETVIRRAARIAARGAGAELLAVHVTRSNGLTGASPRTSAALTTTSSVTMSLTRFWTSRVESTPPNSCWAAAGDVYGDSASVVVSRRS
ncbi:hypothetical protein [Tenggerimyces flavus]|uniref:UspA domain-containing protein n=1 Tax=Tenggerimyces flavus TaxID=1708749 RepID=A0ABV7YBZ4_9ACTN|nr:hypothetical protein [Tenggerimyces flavus]